MNWNQRYNYNFPTSIRFGAGVLDELAPYLNEQKIKRPQIVSDAFLTGLPFFKSLISTLEKSGIKPSIYSGISKNPVKKDVLSGVKHYHEEKCDGVIGLGGGASMDVARAIVLKAYHERDLFDFDDALGGDKFVTGEIPHFITIPTTCGTGSEVGRSTVIAEDDTHKKRILFSPRLLARKVFADPSATLDLPAGVTATTGMDALTHNLEAYLAKGFSPLCDGIAIEGIRLVYDSLENAVLRPNLESRSKMMMASLMGATAFQKGLGVVHSLAHPLSTVYDLHHGLANAVMLPFGLEFNLETSKDRYTHLTKVLDLSEKTPSALIKWVEKLNANIKIPSSLKALNLDESKIERLAQLALEDACHQSNPRPVTLNDFTELYKKAFK